MILPIANSIPKPPNHVFKILNISMDLLLSPQLSFPFLPFQEPLVRLKFISTGSISTYSLGKNCLFYIKTSVQEHLQLIYNLPIHNNI